MSLQLRDPKKTSGGRIITVTSTLPDEGKSTTVSWLATIAAQNGDKVLVIDADMRRPSLHKQYDIGNAKGLSDYLSDRLPLDDVIFDKHPSGVHILTSKAIPTHALTLLTSDRMESLLRRVRDIYDLILIDAPTSLVFSDARVMAKMSDKTFYIIEWKKTRRDICMAALKQFTDMDYKNLAIVLNKADIPHYIENQKSSMAYFQKMT
jgi:capsular exopolysaccharide synthesis family protein